MGHVNNILRRVRRVFIIGAVCAVSMSAHAANDETAFQPHFAAAVDAYTAGRNARKFGDEEQATASFRRAAEEYRLAYAASPQSKALYGAAQTHRALGELDRALRLYEEYLREDPNGAYASAARTLVPGLREQVERKAATTVAPPTGAPSPEQAAREKPAAPQAPPRRGPSDADNAARPEPAPIPIALTPTPTPPILVKNAPPPARDGAVVPGRAKKIVGIALLAVAGGAVVGGVVAGVLSGQAADAIRAEARSGTPFDPSQESAGKTDNVVSGLMYGVAGAAAIAGSVLFYLGIRESRATSRSKLTLAPVAAPGVGGAILSVRF